MTVLKILCGVPGSGKSTYIKNHAKPEDAVISRDAIRSPYLSDSTKNFLIPAEEVQKRYFAKEKQVFKEFCAQINNSAQIYPVVWVDATHLGVKSRWKLLNNINISKFKKITFIAIEAPLEICLERNAARKGWAKVPEPIVKKMFSDYKRPSCNEFLDLDNIEIEIIKNY